MEHQYWQKAMRLRRPGEFRRVWSTGRSWAHPLLVLWALPNELDHVRVGITASRKVGNAVARNRARRLLREAIRHLYPRIAAGWDVVLIARSSLITVKEPQAESALRSMLNHAGLWTSSMEDDER